MAALNTAEKTVACAQRDKSSVANFDSASIVPPNRDLFPAHERKNIRSSSGRYFQPGDSKPIVSGHYNFNGLVRE
jgi:hypothetical protein